MPNFVSLEICVRCQTDVECIRRSAPSSLEVFPNPHCNAEITLTGYTKNQKVSRVINAGNENKEKNICIGNGHAKSQTS